MKLRSRTLLALALLLAIATVAISGYVLIFSLDNYSDLEREYMTQDLDQARHRITEKSATISAIVSDWGPWDDTWEFVNGSRPDYVRSNLMPEVTVFHNLRVDLILILDRGGEVIYAGAYDQANRSMMPVPAAIAAQLTPGSPLLNTTDPRGETSGILMVEDRPMAIASRPIVRTDFSGDPQGVVIMGAYLDPDTVVPPLPDQDRSLRFIPADDPALAALPLSAPGAGMTGPRTEVRIIDQDTVAGYALIQDIDGKDALVLELIKPRSIYHQGINTTFQFVMILLGIWLCSGIVGLVSLDRLVLSRLGALREQVRSAVVDADASRRIEIGGNDEFSALAGDINRSLEAIYTTQRQLQASEMRFRQMADLLPQIVFELDTQGRLTYINRMGSETFGLTPEVLALHPLVETFIAPEDRERLLRNRGMATSGGTSPGEIYTMLRQDGTPLRVMVNAAAIVENGVFQGVRGSMIDLSDRLVLEEALRESEEKYRALTESNPDVLFSADLDGVVTYISPQVNRYGYLEEDLVGSSILSIIHQDERPGIAADLKREILNTAQYGATFRINDRWENIFWVEAKSFVRLDSFGTPIGIYGVLRDISERKRAEEAIELANKKLNLMNNITRHDILNTITGLLGCVDMTNATDSADERRVLLQDIRHLTNQIQRQIAFTKEYQEVGVHLPRWQNVIETLQRVKSAFERDVEFMIDLVNAEIYADPLLEKVFYNLVDNAIRYGEKVTTIRFFLLISDEGLTLVCEDDGVGVAEGLKQVIFERGVGKNTGMGLFLSREILGITRISISENGVPGQGARFEIFTPRGTYRFVK